MCCRGVTGLSVVRGERTAALTAGCTLRLPPTITVVAAVTERRPPPSSCLLPETRTKHLFLCLFFIVLINHFIIDANIFQ